MMDISDLIPVEAYDRVLPDKSSYGKVIKVSALKQKTEQWYVVDYLHIG